MYMYVVIQCPVTVCFFVDDDDNDNDDDDDD